ncbi:hypothetical protein TSUD_17010 [Trifolium subterraneum]|uniref:RING-type domain-containing protein n=1 Tax=Trifolium subterraneum TaxID=3900 RepID=A0A2Z6MQK1_TRISU|nr:hypothetical protein TSUD_17010 [Trifolium subterraneum]
MSSEVSGDYMNYSVHIPPTPDNQPMDDSSVTMKAEEQYVSNSLFTGGFNSVTRAHLMDRVIDSEVTHPQMAGAKGSSCSVCDGKVSKDERGNDITPCECRYKICRDCFLDAQKESGKCPGCKEKYKVKEYEDDSHEYSNVALSLPGTNGSKQNGNGEFDQNKWLFESEGTYGVGNAYWSPDDDDENGDVQHAVLDGDEESWKPLCRVIPIPSGIISPYRLLIAVRLVVMCFFLHWRVFHPNEDADRRRVKREYDEFKVRINGLPDSIRRRSDAFNAREEMKMMKHLRENKVDPLEPIKVLKATWMADGTHWPGTWLSASSEHAKGDHAGILQVMLKPPSPDPLMGTEDDKGINFSTVDTRLPMLVYVSREKRPGYDHNKKAGAMNALVRASAILSNGPFILNLDCDHYIYNCKAIREGMCFMMDRGGEDICYIQFPQRFEGIDPSDRYANHNTVFFDGNMRALDGLQGPFYVGTGCMFRRFALYGFYPPTGDWDEKNPKHNCTDEVCETTPALNVSEFDEDLDVNLLPKRFGNSTMFAESIPVAEFQGRPLADHPAVKYGRPPGELRKPRAPLDASTVAESVSVISCWYEDKTEWGERVGWIYGSVTEDVVTGYRMHNRGWRSVYCVTKRDAFRGSAPINLTDRLHQVLRWATGSVEIFFSKNNAFLGSKHLKILQRLAYLNVGIYPFTSVFLIVYCFLPALSLFSGYFIVQTLSIAFLIYLLTMTVCLVVLAILEVKWSGVELEQWWRNEQFWLISGTSAHLAAVVQGLLKVMAGIEISFTLTSKSAGEDNDDIFADLYIVKWSSLMIPPIVIAMVNIIAIVVAFSRTIYSPNPQWSKFIGGGFFSLWVLAHLYPFAKGLMGRRGKTPTIVFVWSGLIAIILSLLWVSISPPSGAESADSGGGGDFQFP